MSWRSIHFGGAEVWRYKVGQQYTVIVEPGRVRGGPDRRHNIRNSDLLGRRVPRSKFDHFGRNRGEASTLPSDVKCFIQLKLRPLKVWPGSDQCAKQAVIEILKFGY